MRYFLLLFLVTTVSCATTSQTRTAGGATKNEVKDEVAIAVPDTVEEEDDSANQEVLDQAQNKITIFPDVPHEDDKKVDQWVSYFTGRGRKWMEIYLERSSRYLPLMKSILKQNGLPEDLVFIAMIESGFAPSVRSRAGAVGYWQFITATGRRYGLTINSLLDERRDPLKSTQAAADYFKSLYNLFDSWYLAFAAYNGGENRVVRSVMKYRTRDFWDLVQNKKALHKETINYIPKFLAARLIAKDPEKYGFTGLEYHDAIIFDEIKSDRSVYLKKLAKELNIAYDDLKELNPQFTTEYAPAYKDKSVIIRVPKDLKLKAEVALANSYIDNQAFLAKLQTNTYTKFKVRRGDTLSTISHKLRISIASLRDLNGLKNGALLRAGRYIKVPMGSGYDGEGDRDSKIVTHMPSKRLISSIKEKTGEKTEEHTKAATSIYVVRRGDNLTRIARKYRVDLRELLAANRFKNSSRIFAGRRILIPD